MDRSGSCGPLPDRWTRLPAEAVMAVQEDRAAAAVAGAVTIAVAIVVAGNSGNGARGKTDSGDGAEGTETTTDAVTMTEAQAMGVGGSNRGRGQRGHGRNSQSKLLHGRILSVEVPVGDGRLGLRNDATLRATVPGVCARCHNRSGQERTGKATAAPRSCSGFAHGDHIVGRAGRATAARSAR